MQPRSQTRIAATKVIEIQADKIGFLVSLHSHLRLCEQEMRRGFNVSIRITLFFGAPRKRLNTLILV